MLTLLLRLLVVVIGIAIAILLLFVKENTNGLTFEINSDTPILNFTLVFVITVLVYLITVGVVGVLSLSYEPYDIEKVNIGKQVESVTNNDVADACYYLDVENDYIIHYNRNYVRNLKETSISNEMYVFGSKNYKNLSNKDKEALRKLDIDSFKVELANIEVKGDINNEDVSKSESNEIDVDYNTVNKILELEEIIDGKDTELYNLSEAVKKKNEEISRLNEEILRLNEEISRLDEGIKEKDSLLIKKDKQINRLDKVKEVSIKYIIIGFISIWVMVLITVNMIVRLRLKVKKELILTASDAKIREGVMLEEDRK